MRIAQSKITSLISLTVTGIIALFLGILPLYFNTFPLTTPDAGGLACAAETLARTGHFNTGRTTSPNFAICWTKEHYPLVQIMNASILKILPLPSWQVVPVTAVFMYLGCVFGIFSIAYSLTKSRLVASITALFAASTPALLRSLILTPQNVYGYFVAILLVLVCIRVIRKPWWPWWILIAFLAAILAFTHTLSFGITAIALAIWFWIFFLASWWQRLLLAGLGGAILFINERFMLLPVSMRGAWNLFRSSFSGYNHPLYDHPAIWGYIITALAAVGIALSTKLPYKVRWLLITLIIIPVTLGHLSFIGLQLLPERFIPFAWIGLVIFAGIGMYELQQRLRLSSLVWSAVVVVLCSAQIVHAVIFIQDDVYGWSARFRPRPEFIQAVQWLNTQPDEGTLLGIMAVSNREISFAPLWYDGMIANYPWYNLDHKNIKNFQANSSLYTPILQNPEDPEYKRVHAIYSLITTPNDPVVPTTLEPYNLKYFILPKSSQTYKIWQQQPSLPFQLIYENDKYTIYALK